MKKNKKFNESSLEEYALLDEELKHVFGAGASGWFSSISGDCNKSGKSCNPFNIWNENKSAVNWYDKYWN
jgi:hypothetical protein